MRRLKARYLVEREIRLRIQEMRDGCCDCREQGWLCVRHKGEATEMTLHPRAYIEITPEGKVREVTHGRTGTTADTDADPPGPGQPPAG